MKYIDIMNEMNKVIEKWEVIECAENLSREDLTSFYVLAHGVRLDLSDYYKTSSYSRLGCKSLIAFNETAMKFYEIWSMIGYWKPFCTK